MDVRVTVFFASCLSCRILAFGLYTVTLSCDLLPTRRLVVSPHSIFNPVRQGITRTTYAITPSEPRDCGGVAGGAEGSDCHSSGFIDQ
jgi:hypothetical protein